MEDTIFKYPNHDTIIVSNAEEVREHIQLARLLGREVMTPNEFRESVGLKPKFGVPDGLEMP